MSDKFESALKIILEYEGGNDNDPHDPGGRTSRGIIQREYNLWCRRYNEPIQSVWLATDDQIEMIYRENYWDPLMCDDMPAGVDLVLFDSGVNSGCSQAIKWLQRSLNVVDDGVLGPHTFTAVTDERDIPGLITEICGRRLNMLEHLSIWKYYHHGWTNRVHDVQSKALEWAKGASTCSQDTKLSLSLSSSLSSALFKPSTSQTLDLAPQ
jgi:lysozyme family protein